MRQFLLPGGEAAIREPRRAAAGMLYELFGEDILTINGNPSLNGFADTDRRNLLRLLSRRMNCPITSSAGRIFDAVASLLDVCHTNTYEGQAAMAVGFLAEMSATDEVYPFAIDDSAEPSIIDWRPMIKSILDDVSRSVSKETIAGKFHNTLCDIIIDIAKRAGEKRVVLSGGCLQNRYLSERAIHYLQQAGFEPYWHHRIPPNDGGIAAGQILALARLRNGEY
jgi:hydrogenase maturation protein HypF